MEFRSTGQSGCRSVRRAADGRTGACARLGNDAARSDGPTGRSCLKTRCASCSLALSHVDGLGAGAHISLQRRLRRTTLGKKHPWALGKPASEVWSEIWKDIGPLIHRVMETGEASWEETLLLILERSGYPEETYHTFSYSPLAGPDGKIAGMLCVVMEDTVRVIGERQLASLSALAASWQTQSPRQEVFAAIERGLDRTRRTCRCTLTYLFDEDGTTAPAGGATGHRCGSSGSCVGDRSWLEPACRGRCRALLDSQSAPSPSTICLSYFLSCRRVLGQAADASAPGSDHAPRAGEAGRRLHCGAQSLSSIRLDLRGISRPGGRPDCRAAITNAEAYEAGRSAPKPGRAGPRQDGVLQQCEPRTAHAAHADSGPDGGCDYEPGKPSAVDRWRCCTATRCAC